VSGAKQSPRRERASTAVVGVVLLVGLTVSLSAVVLGTATTFGQTVGPAPEVSHSTATFETGPSVGCGDNVVRIVHEGGDAVSPEHIAILVRLPAREANARLRALPVSGTQLRDEHVVDDDHNVVYDNCVGGVVADGGEPWVAGRALAFELNAGGGTISPGDTIDVTVVHEPTGASVVETEVIAT
jgi:FlaG/FlaF family flagellin (archaellin)